MNDDPQGIPDPDEGTDPDGDTDPDGSPGWRPTLARFRPFLRGHRRLMVLAAALFAVATAADTVAVLMLSRITDRALVNANLASFWSPALTWAAAGAVAALLSYAGMLLTGYLAEVFAVRVRAATYASVLRMSPQTLDQHATGDLLSRIVDDVDLVEAFVVTGMVDAAASATGIVVYATAATVLNWQLALVAGVGSTTAWLVSRYLAVREARLSLPAQRAHGQLVSDLERGLTNSTLIQAYTAHRAEANRLSRATGRLFLIRMHRQRFSAAQGPLAEVVHSLGLLVVLGVGITQIVAGNLSVGGLLAFVAYLEFLQPGVAGLGELNSTAAAASGSAERLVELLQHRPEFAGPAGPVRRLRSRGEIEARGIGVVGSDGTPRLEGASLSARPGELLVLSGPSGAGKSTLIQVLGRLREPSAGQVLLDGVDLHEYPLEAVHRLITVVPQDPFVVDGTIRENLGYGLTVHPPAGFERGVPGPATGLIRPVTLASGAEHFLRRLPDGYDTRVGSRGRALSGGQRQQLGIARALLRDAPVLILDEPSTGLDRRATDHLVMTLRQLAARRTVIVATHDPVLLAAADRVVELRTPCGVREDA